MMAGNGAVGERSRVSETENSERVKYERLWQRLRLGTRLYWIGVGVTIAVGLLVINPPVGPLPPMLAVATVFVVAFSVTTIYALYIRTIKCPRCASAFAGTNLGKLFFPNRRSWPPTRCVSCGLTLGAPFDPAATVQGFTDSSAEKSP
jgi:hypothetical protein